MVQTNKKLAAERQIHAAIKHYREGGFECAITLCSAVEGQMPESEHPRHLFRILQQAANDQPSQDGEKDDFNFVSNWLKHDQGGNEKEIDDTHVLFWLNRAISKYREAYGPGTPEMVDLFQWASENLQSS